MSGEAKRDEYYLPAGRAAGEPYVLETTPATDAPLSWSSLRVVELGPDEEHRFATGDEEMFVLPLSGSCRVVCDGEEFTVRGRENVFNQVSDSVYVPRDADVQIISTVSGGRGRFALPGAACRNRWPARYRPADDVPVEVRGAGNSTRQVNNFGAAHAFEADRLIAVEVLTPAGNWSSYPAHKHDEDRPGEEAVLEEIYYFEISDGPGEGGVPSRGTTRRRGFGFHRVYGTPERPIEVLEEVRTGDVVLIPHGWHGPSVAAPGYHMYYLNVMAGPGAKREWLICDDPEHAWVRGEWEAQDPDPRLPFT
ncbi:5-deoxy-glucuronate isomerase [Actinobacteria bacterium YIM 96077]|uniref:5-deoxy-glucuronate isomerase n=1 Tax=Phytoactinopolyspora halophila TaxID=1981511 RepID=A0A329QCF7_9ACTN|nr:5-deoxy-glucuronate isomerase [Phytoactinopolyspora halophila]AYY13917.1 5-deoxy-glucuronate isomerase [Actinobacteria bacterium YIM 96077]RAW10046.1 5-deoxy-glucuronate isomerase [Phytoactinopolyspora halophila]